MSDLDAIRTLVHQSSDAVCRRDAGDWGATWAAAGVWDIGNGPVAGREAVTAAWVEAMNGFDSVVQTVLNGTATLTGDTGTGRWHFQEYFVVANGGPGMLFGVYDDAYTREADEWRFARRVLTVLYLGALDFTGWCNPEYARRDPASEPQE